MAEICADCGTEIGMLEASYYRKDPTCDIGRAFHSRCGDPFGAKAKDAEIKRLRAALIEIRDHWANQYDHPRKQSPMYAGPYGIGVTDGHRAAAIIAQAALTSGERE